MIFSQDTTDRAAEIEEVFKGVGLWNERAELEDVDGGTPLVTNKVTYNVVNYAKSIDISKRFFDDNMHSVYENMVKDMGTKARITQDEEGLSIYKGGFDTYTTADGSYIFATDHTTISGDTVNNLGTAALSETSLNDAIISLMEQKDQAGVVRGNTPKCLLVPPALFKTACEIVDSELRSGTANNDMNIYSSKYGIYIATSNRLGAVAGGSDTAWFLIGDNAAPKRYVRQGIITDLVDYKYQRNNSYIYKGEFREVVGATDYVGLYGNTGAA